MEVSDRLSIKAIAVAVLAFGISCTTAWFTTLRPAKISAVMPHCVMWQFSSWIEDRPTGEVVSRQMTPYLVMRNVGARPIVVEDLRLRFVSDGGEVKAYPVSKVPFEVIVAPGTNTRRHGLGEGAPFPGIILAAGEEWKNSYAFSMNLKSYEVLKEEVEINLEIREGGENEWKSILKDVFSFGLSPYHLQPLKTEDTVIGSMNAHVYSRRWHDTRKKDGF